MNKVQEIREVVDQLEGVVLYFKNDNCGPCKVLRPKVEEMISRSFPNLQMVVLDSEKYPELNLEFNVFANPTILVFFNGKEYLRKSKYLSIQEFESEIDRLYKMAY